MVPTYDLIVVGGGIIGCGIADRLRAVSSRICLIEQGGRPESGASWAAAGGINPHLDDCLHGSLGLMAERSRDLFPDWIARLSAAAGTPLELRRPGLLQVAIDEKERARLADDVRPFLRERGVEAYFLTGDQARAREPLLGPGVTGALAQPRDMAVEPAKIMDAFTRAFAADERVDLVSGRVAGVVTAGGGVKVTLTDGRTFLAGRVVVAAGHASHAFLGLRSENFMPVKGQVLEVLAPAGGGLKTQCDALISDDDEAHVVVASPYAPGRITVGVTFEYGVTDTEKTAEARELILRNLRRVLPALAEGQITDARAGIRPGTSDGAPVLGFVDDGHRILAATGHNGLGITLAPRTAQLAAKLLLDLPLTSDDRYDLRISSPDRFRIEPSRAAARPL
jgi:glycine oxidase